MTFIELGVEDADRGRAFYEAVFGWRFEPGPSGNGYMIHTPDGRAGIHGGDAGASPYVFFAVQDIDAAMDRVRELGGVVEDVDVEGDEESQAQHGRFRLCRDDQGSPFGLHQPPAPDRATRRGGLLGQVLRERDLLRRRAVLARPSRSTPGRRGPACSPSPPSASSTRRSAPRLTSWRRTAGATRTSSPGSQDLLLALDQQRQRPLQHEVDLLLALVAVDAPALARLEHHLVDPEARDPERAAQRDEALAGVGIERGACDAVVHGRRSYDEHGCARSRAR